MARTPAPTTAATPAQKKTLLRLLQSRDDAAQAQARVLLQSLADPGLYEAALGALAAVQVRETFRSTEHPVDLGYVTPAQRPFRATPWSPAWHWPPGAPTLRVENRDADDDTFALLAAAPSDTPVVKRLAETTAGLSLVLQQRFRAAEHFEPGLLAPFTSLRALHLTTHRTFPLTRARLAALGAALPGLRTLVLTNAELPDGLDALEGLPELEVLEVEARGLASLASLPALPRLHTLLLRNVKALTTLGPAGRFPALARFVVQGAGALADLGALEGCVHLESLRILYAHGLRELAPLRASRALTTLSLLSVRGLASLEALSEMRSLAHLDVVAPGAALATLAHVPFERLEVLSVEHAEGLTTLGPARAAPKLTSVSLVACPALGEVGALSEAHALERVDLRGASCLRSVAPLAGKNALHQLDLRDSGVNSPEPFAQLPALRAVGLASTGISPAQLPVRARVAASFHPQANLDALDARLPAHLARLAAETA